MKDQLKRAQSRQRFNGKKNVKREDRSFVSDSGEGEIEKPNLIRHKSQKQKVHIKESANVNFEETNIVDKIR